LPPRSSVIGEGGDSPAAALYAVTRSSFAPWVTLSPAWFVPVIVIVPVPVIAGLGKLPMSPFSVVGPVLVIPAPARTTKLPAVPNGTTTAAA
jgi:hypothetical protein